MNGKKSFYLLITIVCVVVTGCSLFGESQTGKPTSTVVPQPQKVIPTISDPMSVMIACEKAKQFDGRKDTPTAVGVKLFSQKDMKGICFALTEIAYYPFQKLENDFHDITGSDISSFSILKGYSVIFSSSSNSGIPQLKTTLTAKQEDYQIKDFGVFKNNKTRYPIESIQIQINQN